MALNVTTKRMSFHVVFQASKSCMFLRTIRGSYLALEPYCVGRTLTILMPLTATCHEIRKAIIWPTVLYIRHGKEENECGHDRGIPVVRVGPGEEKFCGSQWR